MGWVKVSTRVAVGGTASAPGAGMVAPRAGPGWVWNAHTVLGDNAAPARLCAPSVKATL